MGLVFDFEVQEKLETMGLVFDFEVQKTTHQ